MFPKTIDMAHPFWAMGSISGCYNINQRYIQGNEFHLKNPAGKFIFAICLKSNRSYLHFKK